MEKKLLIAGIDPGTTSAYAVLDIDGNLINAKSQKGMGLNAIIREIVSLGRVVLVGTDKSKVPSLVSLFSARTGAKTISPPNDLRLEEKRELVRDFEAGIGNEHQKDAAAAALYAYKKVSQLMRKIDVIAENSNLKNGIKEIVIRNGTSIYEAVRILNPKKEEHEVIQKLMDNKELNEADFSRLFEKLKKYSKENEILKRYNRKLKDRIIRLEKNLEDRRLSKSDIYSKIDNIFVFKEKRLKNYEQIIREKTSNVEFMRAELNKLVNLMANKEQYYVLKKLDTLGSSQFETRKILLNIKKDDILLVDNPNIISGRTVDELREVVSIIVHNKPASRKIMTSVPFVFISSKNLSVQDLGVVACVEKSELDREKNRHNVLAGMIENYKRERINLI